MWLPQKSQVAAFPLTTLLTPPQQGQVTLTQFAVGTARPGRFPSEL